VAELYASGPFSDAALRLFSGIGDVYSWTAHGNEEFRSRLARLAGGNIRLFPFRGMRPGEHAADYYARCVGITPVSPGADLLCVDRQTVSATIAGSRLAQADWLLLHPGSGSPAKNWQGFEALVRYWRQVRQQPVALLLGPAEIERSATQPPGSHPLPLASQADVVIASASLPEVAAWLAAAPLYAGNDSGISHLAAPCGARGVVLFASSDPVAWAPRSPLLRVLHRPRACRLCGKDVFCIHRLPVDDVIAALDVMAAARPAGEG
jgi:ADP-heptose:LPS heptosyltransferase